MLNTKKEYLAAKAAEYDKLVKAEKLAAKLESKIADIRSQGYKIIVLGSKVKITFHA